MTILFTDSSTQLIYYFCMELTEVTVHMTQYNLLICHSLTTTTTTNNNNQSLLVPQEKKKVNYMLSISKMGSTVT